MPEPNLQINVAGHWLTLEFILGDVSMSTIWPGGSDELSWTLPVQSYRRFTGGEPVSAYFGPIPVWAGTLLEPDPSQDQLTAQGLWRLGDNYPAMNAAGTVASANPNAAIDSAISRGLAWTRPNSISAGTPVDLTQGPVTIGFLLDTLADNTAVRWGVDPTGVVFATIDDTTPTYQTRPAQGGLGYALDNYASTLFARYLDSATSTFKTVTVTDAVAEALHGHVEAVVDITDRGAITAANATTFTTNLLTLGRSTPQWTSDITVSYGELLTMGGTPVALETVAAGRMVRVWGGIELPQRQNGAMYVDILIGQTKLSGGTLNIQPFRRATRTYQDFVTAALTRKRRGDAPDR